MSLLPHFVWKSQTLEGTFLSFSPIREWMNMNECMTELWWIWRNYASTANIEEVLKFYNLGHKTFETDFRFNWIRRTWWQRIKDQVGNLGYLEDEKSEITEVAEKSEFLTWQVVRLGVWEYENDSTGLSHRYEMYCKEFNTNWWSEIVFVKCTVAIQLNMLLD